MISALSSLFSCCRRKADEDIVEPTYDETSYLIPTNIDPPVVYSNAVLVDHAKLYQRMENIVRAKEGKMVNVASNIPFNLHNQVIPKERSRPSLSRSSSSSVNDFYDDQYHPHNEYFEYPITHNASRGRQNSQALHSSGYLIQLEGASRSSSPSPTRVAGPSRPDRSMSRVSDQPRPTPILNVRLVGYKDNQVRGRTKQRGPLPSGLAPSSTTTTQDSASEEPRKPVPIELKLPDTPLIMSWGD